MRLFKTMDDVLDYAEPKMYRKVALHTFVQIAEDFVLDSPEYVGRSFKAGSWVGINPKNGHIWCVDDQTFKDTYKELRSAGYVSTDGVEILQERIDYDAFFKIASVLFRYQLPNGTWMEPSFPTLVFERGDAVALLVYNIDTGMFEMEEQFRLPTYKKDGGWITELPAGMIKEGENPEVTSLRELEEELGWTLLKPTAQWKFDHNQTCAKEDREKYKDDDWDTDRVELINVFYVSPGGTSERIFLFYAEVSNDDNKAKGGGLASESEYIKRVEMYPGDALRVLQDAKSIIAAQWWLCDL